MPFIAWNPSFAVGIESIDEQHRELFRRISDLMDSMADGRGLEAVAGLVSFLEAYVHTHFADEQAEMRRAEYPALAAHLVEHDAFVEDLARLKRELVTGGVTASLTIAVNNRVCQWLVEHILRSDRAFGAFARRRPPQRIGAVALGL